ncbi:stage III sporulation protein AA [Bacillus horti]|uniref:Stage III sporulation protein AA n=1 Tax=Caldalkalibacillus horti TaxID=77523 RepID=A0ABT9W0Y2_9BACI|nr:stage III sporulation protein AA [Bacillus horti]MDQ0166887.1 stage III sporulation protein AA [Bacillus horti]
MAKTMREDLLVFLPQHIRQALSQLPQTLQNSIEEIRIRIQRPLEVIIQNQSYYPTEKGSYSMSWQDGIMTSQEDALKIMNVISRHSIYAIEEELRRGYITVQGGHRIGIAGRAVVEEGRIKHLKDIRSFNIRIARQCIGIAEGILKFLIEQREKKAYFCNTLIISPPRCGKTTLLRDLTRMLSYGTHKTGLEGQKVGVVDERSEIASCIEGIPQNDLGPRVDVLDACPKAEGMMLLIRSMSPDIIVTDEIGSVEDTRAILEALHAGVYLLTSAHGFSLEDIKSRPSLESLFQQPVFERFILLSKRNGVGTIEAIYDKNQKPIYQIKKEGRIYA